MELPACDIGSVGGDATFGAGLLDALKAVQVASGARATAKAVESPNTAPP